MKAYIILALEILAAYCALDLLGFMAWIASGQLPVDSFYLGAFTHLILKLCI